MVSAIALSTRGSSALRATHNLRGFDVRTRIYPRKQEDIPVSFLVQAVSLLDIVQGVLLERLLDEMQYVEDMVILRSTPLVNDIRI